MRCDQQGFGANLNPHSFPIKFIGRTRSLEKDTHAACNKLLILGVLHGARVVGDLVALGLEFVPGVGVDFLKNPKMNDDGHVTDFRVSNELRRASLRTLLK